MKRQAIIILALLAAVALVLGGCSGNKTDGKDVQTTSAKQKKAKDKQAKAADPELQKLLDAMSGKPSADPAVPGASPTVPGMKPMPGAKPPTAARPGKPGAPAGVTPGKRPKTMTPEMMKDVARKPTSDLVLSVIQTACLQAQQVRVESTSSVSVKYDGKAGKGAEDQKVVVLFQRPNKFRVSGAGTTMCSDGSTVYLYDSRSKTYAKRPMEEKVLRGMALNQGGVEVLGLLAGFDYSSIVSSSKMLADQKIGGRDSWVLLLDIKAVPGMPKGTTAKQKLWVDKKDFTIHRSEITTRTTPKAPKGAGDVPKLIETVTVSNVSRFDYNAKLSAADFKFTPPAEAKLYEPPKPVNLQDKHAPDLAFQTKDGARKLSELRGKVVVLSLWALPFSEKQIPVLQQFCKQESEGVEVVAINLNRDREQVEAFLSKKGYSFPTSYADDKLAEAILKGYGMLDGPTIYVIDKEGIVRRILKGDPKLDDLNAKVQKVAKAG